MLERDEQTRRVNSVARLDQRPILSALSRAVGTPAFSISQLRFVFVEGEEGVGERERFHKLTNAPQHVRFMECGSCKEVERRVAVINALATESEAGIRIGGIVDRDFMSDTERGDLQGRTGIFALPVHEIENLSLHPGTLRRLFEHNGVTVNIEDFIQRAADDRAGSWIFQYAMSRPQAKRLAEVPVQLKEHAKGLTWSSFVQDESAAIGGIVALSGFDQDGVNWLEKLLRVAASVYGRVRAEAGLWRNCEGKQVLAAIAPQGGFAGPPALISATLAAWSREGAELPAELVELREYVASL